jgi:hypothetical protein
MHKSGKFPRFLLPVTLALLAVQASNLSGKWNGLIVIDDTASGTKIETPVELHLEQNDGVLSGKIGQKNNPDRVEIRNAKIDQDRLTFEAASLETSGSMRFSLKVQGEHMEGDMKGVADGSEIVAKVSFSRAK